MNRTIPVLLATSLLAAVAAPAEDASEWRSMFNGRDLDGWTVKIAGRAAGDNHGNLFRVDDGVLKVSYDQYERFNGEFGHLFYKEKLSNYVMRLEYRVVGEQSAGGPGWALRNSGIMIHGQSPESMRVEQDFPVSIEVQLLGGDGENERSTGNLCTPGTHVVMDDRLVTQHCINSSSETFHGDQWVTAEVEVHGSGAIRHRINGVVVMEYSQPQLDPGDADAKLLIPDGGELLLHGGTVSLQAESHPFEFRNIMWRPLAD
jgi:hypothetical protein